MAWKGLQSRSLLGEGYPMLSFLSTIFFATISSCTDTPGHQWLFGVNEFWMWGIASSPSDESSWHGVTHSESVCYFSIASWTTTVLNSLLHLCLWTMYSCFHLQKQIRRMMGISCNLQFQVAVLRFSVKFYLSVCSHTFKFRSQTYLPTYLPTYLLIYRPTYRPTYLST